MRVGVPTEVKADEYRVALTPAGAFELSRRGHEVTIEEGAGAGSAFPDEAYTSVGARIASVADVWAESDVVLKVERGVVPSFAALVSPAEIAARRIAEEKARH